MAAESIDFYDAKSLTHTHSQLTRWRTRLLQSVNKGEAAQRIHNLKLLRLSLQSWRFRRTELKLDGEKAQLAHLFFSQRSHWLIWTKFFARRKRQHWIDTRDRSLLKAALNRICFNLFFSLNCSPSTLLQGGPLLPNETSRIRPRSFRSDLLLTRLVWFVTAYSQVLSHTICSVYLQRLFGNGLTE